MKILHTADIHLGSKLESKFPKEKSDTRKKELLNSFGRMVEYANQNDIKIILLSGDVFDRDKPTLKDKGYFYTTIKNNPHIDFYYLNGNHDKEGSYVENEIANLKTFSKTEFTSYELENNLVISGIEMNPENAKSFYSKLKLDKNKTNIVMLHGDVTDTTGMDKIKIDNLKNKNIDYLALGHIHSYKTGRIDDRGTYAFPGCLEGRGFDECGEKGFIVLDYDGTINSIEFVPFAIRTIEEIDVDITNQESLYDIEKLVKQKVSNINKNNILRINLVGEISLGIEFTEEDIEISLRDYFFVNVKNKTTLKIDIESYQDDKSLIGEFVRGVFNNNDYTDEDKKLIINLGLKAIKGKEVE